mgnify:CR=1 FL=1
MDCKTVSIVNQVIEDIIADSKKKLREKQI